MLNETNLEQADSLRVQHQHEESLRQDLLELGFKRNNIRNLHIDYPDYSKAIGVIFSHLKKPHSDRIHEILGRLLEHPAAFPLWKDLVSMYQLADKDASPGLMTGLAVALSGQLRKSNSAELLKAIIELLRDSSRGLTRVFFLGFFRRKRDVESMTLLNELSTDSDLKVEIASWKRVPR